MDSATEEMYFQKVHEFIQDDDKIITVSSLAKDLDISLQYSKKLINKYVEDQRKLQPNELAVTYILSGLLKSNKGKGVFMVKEADLKAKRNLFDNNNPSELLYSVQKVKCIDFNVIALVDIFDNQKIREKALLGSIVSRSCIRRELEITKLPLPPTSTIKGKSSFFIPKPGNSVASNKTEERQPAKTEKVKPSGNILNLLGNAASLNITKSGSNKNKVHTKENKTTNKKNHGLTSFLTKGSQAPMNKEVSSTKEYLDQNNKLTECAEKEISNGQDDNNDSEKITSEGVDFVELAETDIKPIKETSTPKNKKNKENGTQERKKNKRNREKSEEKTTKRRKRIVERNNSDSDDMFEKDVEIEDIIERSDDETEPDPSISLKEVSTTKIMKKRAVDKTYEDEEGFIVTKTEYVYETESENKNEEVARLAKQEDKSEPRPMALKNSSKSENDVSPKRGAKGVKGRKSASSQNQPTLLNFFKKN